MQLLWLPGSAHWCELSLISCQTCYQTCMHTLCLNAKHNGLAFV